MSSKFFGLIQDVGLPKLPADSNTLITIINIFLGVIGATAVLVTILAGIQFITSEGSPDKVSKAQRTIMYAVIGLLVAIFSSVIVNFVIVEALK